MHHFEREKRGKSSKLVNRATLAHERGGDQWQEYLRYERRKGGGSGRSGIICLQETVGDRRR